MSSFNLELKALVKDALREVLAEARAEKPSAELLTYAQAAAMANVSPSTIKRWVRGGALNVVGAGKIRRVRADAVLAMVGAPSPRLEAEPATVTSILEKVKR